MKLIIAYIQPEKLNGVKKILYGQKIHRFSVVDAFGHSEEVGILESYRGVEMEIDLLKKIRLEIAVNDDFVDPVVKAIIEGGKTGAIGDGKIFVIPIENCFRIRTGEEGSKAIG
jgi:nitrogen regulatory protein P-II 2